MPTLIDFLFERPLIAVKMAKERLGCSYVTANNLVLQFEELGLLEEITGWKRNRRHRFKPYLEMFRGTGDEGRGGADGGRDGYLRLHAFRRHADA